MLKQLMKYEFKANSRRLLPVLLILIIMSVINRILVPVLENSNFRLLNMLSVVFTIAFGLTYFAVAFMTFAVLIDRFRKSVLQDEAYLTLTLPVSADQILWSKLLVSFAWFIIIGIFVAASIMINIIDINALTRVITGLSFADLRYIAKGVSTIDWILYFIEAAVFFFLLYAVGCMMFYMSLTLGNMFKKRKMLASALIFGAVFTGLMVLTVFVMMAGDSVTMTQLAISHVMAVHLFALLMIVSAAVPAAVFYLITRFGLTRKLNLE